MTKARDLIGRTLSDTLLEGIETLKDPERSTGSGIWLMRKQLATGVCPAVSGLLVCHDRLIAGSRAQVRTGFGEWVPQEVVRADLARVSPMLDAHVIATGSYHFARAVRTRSAGLGASALHRGKAASSEA
jgi:hypothetical protein